MWAILAAIIRHSLSKESQKLIMGKFSVNIDQALCRSMVQSIYGLSQKDVALWQAARFLSL